MGLNLETLNIRTGRRVGSTGETHILGIIGLITDGKVTLIMINFGRI